MVPLAPQPVMADSDSSNNDSEEEDEENEGVESGVLRLPKSVRHRRRINIEELPCR